MLLIGRGEHAAAREHARRCVEDLRLLDDLSWKPRPGNGRDEFALTMPPAELTWALRRLDSDAAGAVPPPAAIPMAAYSDPLAQLAEDGRPSTTARQEGGSVEH